MCDASGCPRGGAGWRRFLAIWRFLDRTRRKIGLSLKIRLVSILLPEVDERTFEARQDPWRDGGNGEAHIGLTN